MDGDNRLPPTTHLFLTGGDSIRGTFDLNGHKQSVAGLFGGSGNAQGEVTNTGFAPGTINITGTSTFAGSIRDGSPLGKTGLTKSGSGTFTLSSISDIFYSGPTNVTGGTLALVGRVTQTSAVNVDAGGTLEIRSSERIKDNALFTLNGGILKTNGFSESLGKLTISGSSFIDLGAGACVLNFEPSDTSIWNGSLSILNWTGSINGGGLDRINFLSFGSTPLTPAQVDMVTFINPSGVTGSFPARLTPQNELVAAIPEPRAVCMLLSGLGVLLVGRSRRVHGR